ncbi:MAG TPA: hypothetical protein VJP77_07785 [Planctomycetota bacterium]|nr:hypothetical protein [Planctomycetota bacterium]
MSADDVKAQLFKPRLPEAEVELPNGVTVRVRGMSRGEVLAVQDAKTTAILERRILARGMVEPELTEAEAGIWQEASPAGEIEPVVDRIRDLSGLDDGAEKTAMRSFRGGPDARVRAFPRDETSDDGGAAPGDDG